MKERIFVKKSKEQINLEEFIRKYFAGAKCGNIEVQHTPLVTRIIIYTATPGLVIGTGGEKIREITEILKAKFKLENPQIDVQKIDNPDLDPHIISQNIAGAIENGTNYKRLGKFFVSKIMNTGAIGCEIIFSGKLTGERSRKERFAAGYLKKCGEPAIKDVVKAFAVGNPKLGNVGVTVKIMVRHPGLLKLKEEPKPEEAAKEAEPEKEEEQKEEKPAEAPAEKKEAPKEKPAEKKEKKKPKAKKTEKKKPKEKKKEEKK